MRGIGDSSQYINISNEYDYYNNLKRQTVNNYGLSTVLSRSTYGKRNGCVASEIIGNKKITYTYHTINGLPSNIPKITTYYSKVNSDYEVEYSTETTLTADNKSIEYLRVIKNNTLLSQTKYEYNADGLVIRELTWTEDTDGNGILDENDEYTETNSTYTLNPDKTFTTVNTVPNLKNADGDDLNDVSMEYTSDIFGMPIIKKDAYGRETTIEYDAAHRPVRCTYPNGAQVSTQYNIEENYAVTTDEKGISTKNTYDGFGRLLSKNTNKNGQWIKTYEQIYDSAGRTAVKKEWNTETTGTLTEYRYDKLSRLLKTDVKNLSSVQLYTENYVYTVSGGNHVTTKTTIAADGTETAVEKQHSNELGETVKTELTDGAETYTQTTQYDYLSRPVRQTDAKGGVTSYEYDFRGNITRTVNPINQCLVAEYDMAGRKISESDYMDNKTEYIYDALDRVVMQTAPFDDTRSSEVKSYYDGNSNLIKKSVKTDENEYRSTEYTYDSMGNVTSAVTDGSEVRYTYDTSNRVTEMMHGTEERTLYEYDDESYKTTVTDPMGMSTETINDIFGNIIESKDKNGNTAHYSYSAFGMYRESINSTDAIMYTYNNLGMLTKKTSSLNGTVTDSVEYEYDAFGRKTKEKNSTSEQEYTYDELDLTDYVLKENGTEKNRISYEYNSLNRLTKLTDNGTIFIYEYDENGNLINKTAGADVNVSFSYNKANLPTSMTNKKGDDVVNSYSYTYALDGNRLTDVEQGGIAKEYTYDSDGRLTVETQTIGEITDSYSYTYDEYGNRRSMTAPGGESYDYVYDLNNRLQKQTKTVNDREEVTDYTYDNNGNTLSWIKNIYTETGDFQFDDSDEKYYAAYEYDLRNRVTGINSGTDIISYSYNTDGLRKSKTVNGKTTGYIWSGSNMTAETDSNGITTVYTYDETGVVMANGTERALYLKNAHGDITAVTDINGNVQNTYIYDADLSSKVCKFFFAYI